MKVRDGYDSSIKITISEDCIGCGACIKVCPIGTLSYPGNSPELLPKGTKPMITDPSICFNCGQCMAACPRNAIMHNKLNIADFPPIESVAPITWDQFVAFTRRRRSIRNFSSKPVPRDLITKILDESTRYAPTGMNRQAVEIQIIEGQTLKAVFDEIIAATLQVYRLLRWLHWTTPQMELHWRQMKAIKRTIDLGIFPTGNGQMVLLFLTDNRVKENETDAAILSYQTLLSAEVLGINTCYFGVIENCLPYSRILKKILNLPKHRIVACSLLLGYSNTKYHRYVSRKNLICEIKSE